MKIIKTIGMVVVSGILAIAILSLLMSLYSLTPLHLLNEKGNTDYVWEANSIWTNMNEGIAWGRHDAAGYNNARVIENPDIIIVGSSHMEARNVFQNQTIGSILGQKLADKYSVYNMGISGHDFYKTCQYLPDDCTIYEEVPKAIIVETSSIRLNAEDVDKVLTKTVEFTTSNNTGIISLIQRIPFFRQIYKQMTLGLMDILMPSKNSSNLETVTHEPLKYDDTSVDNDAYEELFEYLSAIEEQYKTQIIIFYHPTGVLLEDGSIQFTDSRALETFKIYSLMKDIDFIDMTEPFENMYYSENHVAHGFITGKLESDHLNAYGHKAIADSLYQVIIKLDEEGKLCR